MRKRSDEAELEQEAERAARAIARHLPDALAEVERRREQPDEDDEDGDGLGTGRKLAIVALLLAAAAAVWNQLQGRDEPDLWGPPAA
jgi:hypothetical protein